MPIWLRKFTFQEIANYIEKQTQPIDSPNEGGSKTVIDKDGKVKLPEVLQQAKSIQRTTYK